MWGCRSRQTRNRAAASNLPIFLSRFLNRRRTGGEGAVDRPGARLPLLWWWFTLPIFLLFSQESKLWDCEEFLVHMLENMQTQGVHYSQTMSAYMFATSRLGVLL